MTEATICDRCGEYEQDCPCLPIELDGQWVRAERLKEAEARVAELEAALTSILEHWHDVSDNTNHNLLQVALKGDQAK